MTNPLDVLNALIELMLLKLIQLSENLTMGQLCHITFLTDAGIHTAAYRR